MNKLSTEERTRVVAAFVDGNSLRSTTRMTGIHRTTIMKLLAELGEACLTYQDKTFVNLKCERIECDEILSFCGAKEKNCSEEMKDAGWGDAWTWVAINPVSKLVPCWLVGGRDAGFAHDFMIDLASRLENRVQLTTDGLRAYLSAVEYAFGDQIDYAMLVKQYGDAPAGDQRRYSPAEVTGTKRKVISGAPNDKHICTSIIERQNLTMRMGIRRFTRLTNGFSKKIENHVHAISLHYMFYNFAKIHQSLRMTPAMAAGVSNHVWSIAEIVALLD